MNLFGTNFYVPIQTAYEPPAVTRPGSEDAVDLLSELIHKRRVRLEGPVWSGKSAYCTWLTMLLKQSRQETALLPILINFRAFAQASKDLQEFIREDYVRELAIEDRKLSVDGDATLTDIPIADWLYSRWLEGRAVLIIDDADESTEQQLYQQTLNSIVSSPAGRQPDPLVLLVSRTLLDPAYSTSVTDFEQYELKELDHAGVRRVLVRLSGDTFASAFERYLNISENGWARELVKRPANLLLMFSMHLEGLTARVDVMTRIAQIRFRYVTGRIDPALYPDERVYKRMIAEMMAYHILKCRTGESQTRGRMLKLIGHVLKEVDLDDTYDVTQQEDEVILRDLCHNSGFLRRCPDDSYEYESSVWLEFFAERGAERRRATFMDACSFCLSHRHGS